MRFCTFYSLVFCFAVLISGCTTTPPAIDKKSIIIGTGGVSGMYFPTGQAICKIINRKQRIHGVSCEAKPTKGSVDNIRASFRGELDFGIGRSEWIYSAYHGADIWNGELHKDLRVIFSTHSESIHLVADSKLKTIYDLKEKKVNIGNPGSLGRTDSERLLTAYEIDLKDLDAAQFRSGKAIEIFKEGKLDAIIYGVGDPSGLTEEAINSRKAKFIPIDGPEVDELIKQFPYYEKTMIDLGWYPKANNRSDVPSFGYKTIFFTKASASDDVVYQITKEVFENLDNFKKLHPSFKELTKLGMVNILDRLAPIHPGALRYYKEVGLK